jgi:hypothetical protein
MAKSPEIGVPWSRSQTSILRRDILPILQRA